MSSQTRSDGHRQHQAEDSPQSRAAERRSATVRASSERPGIQRPSGERVSHGRSTSAGEVSGHAIDAAHRESDESAIAARASGNGSSGVDEAQRREMIATSAYLRAERRGFENGSDVEDWLAAEEEIDSWLRQIDRGIEEPPLFEE